MSGYDDNQGWGDDIDHGYQNSSLRKDEVSTSSASFTMNVSRMQLHLYSMHVGVRS